MRKLISLLLLTFIFIQVQSQEDTVLHARDSVIDMPESCTQRIIERSERVESFNKTILITKAGRTMTMTKFLETEKMGVYAEHAVTDLDNDGKKELIVFNFTGGAHCCDEVYFFKNIAPHKYQFAAKTFAGWLCPDDNDEFVYSFSEHFGYFFTCYACVYEDTSDAGPLKTDNIRLKYNKGKLSVIPGDTELRSQINDNLAKLGELPYQRLDSDIAQDDGQRKELAMNLAVFYYSFGKNLVETRKLFNKYYKHPDAGKVWAAFLKQLQYMKRDNDF